MGLQLTTDYGPPAVISVPATLDCNPSKQRSSGLVFLGT